MTRILTITMNPSIDVSTSVASVIPSRKLRCGPTRRDPGGGGVNVARALKRFGVEAIALYTAGGERGQMLRRMMAKERIEGISLPITDDTDVREAVRGAARRISHLCGFREPAAVS